MKLTGGELYFIGERDHRSGDPTSFVKIGIVRENDARTTENRLNDHQTGNPRKLVVHNVLTMPVVERVETLMHGLLAPKRIGGEWFILEENELKDSISLAELHTKDALRVATLGPLVEDLKNLVAIGGVAPATENSGALTRRRGMLLEDQRHFEQVRRTVVEYFRTLADRGAVLDPYFRLVTREPSVKFDSNSFKMEHADLWKKYSNSTVKVKGTFRPVTPKKTEDEGSSRDSDLGAVLATLRSLIGEASSDEELVPEIHRLYLVALSLCAEVDWQMEVLDYEIRSECGTYSGIEGLCTWNRKESIEEKFDIQAFKQDYPDLYAQYVKVQEHGVAHVVSADRGYRL